MSSPVRTGRLLKLENCPPSHPSPGDGRSGHCVATKARFVALTAWDRDSRESADAALCFLRFLPGPTFSQPASSSSSFFYSLPPPQCLTVLKPRTPTLLIHSKPDRGLTKRRVPLAPGRDL